MKGECLVTKIVLKNIEKAHTRSNQHPGAPTGELALCSVSGMHTLVETAQPGLSE